MKTEEEEEEEETVRCEQLCSSHPSLSISLSQSFSGASVSLAPLRAASAARSPVLLCDSEEREV